MSAAPKRIAIIQFPGSNCEAESAAAIRRNGMVPEEFLWNRPADELGGYDGYFIVGGFSYEDRSRAGVLASLDPVLGSVAAEADKGKPVLGVCNGAQILVESGLVPGARGRRVSLALAPNRRQVGDHLLGSGFFNDWCHLRCAVDPGRTAFTLGLDAGTVLRVPFAHAEGRFLAPPDLLDELMASGQGVFQYCDASGRVDPHFPINPNGSAANLAAVSNPGGNVLAMMPHPERTPGGDAVFASMRRYMETGATPQDRFLDYKPAAEEIADCGEAGDRTLPVSLIISDTTARSVEQCLRRAGIPVSVERRAVWRLSGGEFPDDWEEQLARTGELFNPNKEFVDRKPAGDPTVTAVLRASARDDLRGRRVLETLRHRFHLPYPADLGFSVDWILRFASAEDRTKLLPRILSTHILHNPVADRICEQVP